MKRASLILEFERALLFKHKLTLLEKFQAKSTVVNRKLTDIDVITITSTATDAFVNFLQIKEGAIIFSKNVEVKKKLEESDKDILTIVAQQLRLETNSTHPVIFSNLPLLVKDDSIENTVPQIGDKKKLIDLSLKNVLYLKGRKEIVKEEFKTKNIEILKGLQKDLLLKKFPRIIECFDNSNLQGTDPVASLVRFVDGKPDKNGYRHFNIKTVVGSDDFASMKEIVRRRYHRIQEEKSELPNLIIVDGGKGQLSSAVEALRELNIYGQVPIIGIAKKLEEIYYPEDPMPLHIHKKSQSLLLIQHIRNEAHRFAINFHRLKRSNHLFSGLETIEGIGKKTADLLLSTFKSAKKIRAASEEELVKVVGKSRAQLLKAWQQKKES